jgi:dihydroorotate dehydrogenase (fumarate)
MKNNIGIDIMKFGYKHVAKPIIFHMEPDDAHESMMKFCRVAGRIQPLMWMLHLMTTISSPSMERDLMGIHFKNPFGLSAGLDKTGDLTRCLDEAGFGFEAFGTVTGTESLGNPRPWYHRLPQYDSLLVHAGLPSEGVDKVAPRAAAWKRRNGMILSGSCGPSNKHYENGTDGIIEDTLLAFQGMLRTNGVNIVEINISCPNLQYGEPFMDMDVLSTLFQEIHDAKPDKPIMVKMPSTMNIGEIEPIFDLLADNEYVKGVSVSNLRKDRTGLDIPKEWLGNISGAPTAECNESAIPFVRKHYDDRFVINGIGGTFTPDDALRKLDMGADLVSGITAFMYRGPQTVAEWKRGYVHSVS